MHKIPCHIHKSIHETKHNLFYLEKKAIFEISGGLGTHVCS